MSNHRTSVAMCTYNGFRFVREQLDSIAAQTILPDELIICDDGSTDNTVALLETFAARASFVVRIFSNDNRLGPAGNFAKAIRLCCGDLIVLCDQDDVWKAEKLASLLEAFERESDVVYAFSDADMANEGGTPLGQSVWGAMGLSKKLNHFSGAGQLDVLLKHNLIAGASMAFRASFRDVILPIPAGWMHDYWIALLGSSLFRGAPVPARLYTYRRHPSQVCGWRKKTFFQVLKDSISTPEEDCWKKVEKFRELLSRLERVHSSIPCSEERLRLLKQKEAHLVRRARVRSARGVSRAVDVLAEASTGRYQRYSDSWYSILRDL